MTAQEPRISIDEDFFKHDFTADVAANGIDAVPTFFSGTILEYANFSGLNLPGLVIDTADCAESRWDHATIDGATIKGDGSFMHAHLHATSARDLVAIGIDFAGTKAAGITLDGATFQKCGLNFFHASGGTAIGMTINGGTMVNSFWMNKDLTNAYITDATAISARFNNAYGENVYVVNTDLTDTRWRGADVTGWTFAGSTIARADFGGVTGLTLEQLQSTKDWDLVKHTVLGIEDLLALEAQQLATQPVISASTTTTASRLWNLMDQARTAGQSLASTVRDLRQ